MSNKNTTPGFHPIRHDRLIQEQVHDPYKASHKLPEPTICPQCNAIYREGRWCWGDIPKEANHELCPACHRLNDGLPAGFVSLRGQFFMTHRKEITHLINREEQRERKEHPLKRIMNVEQKDDEMLVTTTDIHLARGIGEAVHRAYRGELDFHYNKEENLLRVNWVH
jgi:hypothetical protein